MKNPVVVTFIIVAILIEVCQAQQPASPLENSFRTYRTMKEQTRFGLEWVSLGPTLNSARADVVQLDHTHPGTMYVGYGSGGIWKTVNHGHTWTSLFEEQSSLGIGDMELAPSNPSIIYVGTGENLKKPRNFTLPGTGMYRSDDAGKTWKHIGLEDSWSIAEIAIHPKDPNIVMVAVLGHLWSTNKNRGLYRTVDGGTTWQQVIYVDEKTGANDVVIAPSNPQIAYASMWEVNPGVFGKNSGVYKSTDGGKSWKPAGKGLPTGGRVGRIGLTVSYSNPEKGYALVDNRTNPNDSTAELYKTLDGGMTWKKTHDAPFKIFQGIGWYFTDVYVNPQDDEEVYCLGIRLAHSTDGGKTFSFLGGKVTRMTPSLAQGLHLDQCELWINPLNPQHIAAGNDGGLYESYDKGLTWTHYNNIPVGEFYDLTIDQSSYTIYGGTQDDATVYGPAKEIDTRFPDPWKYVWIDPWDGGDGCVTQVDPTDNTVVFYSMQHGYAKRLDRRLDSAITIQPELPKDSKDTLNFNYITPYFISPHQAQTLYHGGNYVFKSTDRGDHWNVISGNLGASAIKAKKSFALGALVESRLAKGLLYAGTDKGACWVSKNDGISWEEHSQGLANNYIRSICPSNHAKERVYVAMTGINYDDLHSYLYTSEDYGKTWKSIAAGLPDEPVNVILEDPTSQDILYAGGLRGVYVSANRGKTWSYLGAQMPGAAVADLEMHEATMDLVVATHGRGIYKINVRPIQIMASEGWQANDTFFQVLPGSTPWYNSSHKEPDYRTMEKTNISFWLVKPEPVLLTLVDKDQKVVWTTTLSAKSGFNQYRWDNVVKRSASDFPYFIHYEKFLQAGQYTWQFQAGASSFLQPWEVKPGVSPYTK